MRTVESLVMGGQYLGWHCFELCAARRRSTLGGYLRVRSLPQF